MIDISVDIQDLISAKDIEKLYQLSPGQRARLNKKLGRVVVKESRKRIRQQRDVRGGSLEKRKTTGKGSRKKMLPKLGKGLTVFAGPNKATITWKNNLVGSVAYQHHHGIPEMWTAGKMKRLMGQPDYKAPATREQARSLKALGFKVKREGKTRSPTQKWIVENMSIGQAGLLIKKLDGKPSKKSWFVPVAKRQVLGAENKDIALMADLIIKAVTDK